MFKTFKELFYFLFFRKSLLSNSVESEYFENIKIATDANNKR